MTDVVDYYVSPVSPFVYLGHAAFVTIAREHGAEVVVKPVDLGRVFPVSGGLPLAKRAPQRQHYRLAELRRWSAHRGVPLNPQPRFFPCPADPAALWLLAAEEVGPGPALDLLGAIGRALWAEERNIAEEAVLRDLAAGLGLDAERLAERAGAPDIRVRLDTLTQEAIDRGVFGVPTYVVRGEMYWGQDRLDFVARALAQ